jgi:hypothetical protein
VATSSPAWRVAGVTWPVLLCRCSLCAATHNEHCHVGLARLHPVDVHYGRTADIVAASVLPGGVAAIAGATAGRRRKGLGGHADDELDRRSIGTVATEVALCDLDQRIGAIEGRAAPCGVRVPAAIARVGGSGRGRARRLRGDVM